MPHFVVLGHIIYCFVCLSRKITVGAPDDPNTKMGALISQQHYHKVKGYVEVAKKDGGTVMCGAEDLELPERNKNVRD